MAFVAVVAGFSDLATAQSPWSAANPITQGGSSAEYPRTDFPGEFAPGANTQLGPPSPMPSPATPTEANPTQANTAEANLAAAVKSAAVKPAAEVKAIHSRQNLFGIPFQVNRAADEADAPIVMRLYVSRGAGQIWGLAQEVDPGTGTFMFRATEDGLYLFSLRSVKRNGEEVPAGPHRAGLSVQVDTEPPELQLSAVRGESGEVEIQWNAQDKSLDGESLSISYQTSPYEQLMPLALGQPGAGAAASETLRGTAHWWPQQDGSEIFLRAEVIDRAGNRTVQTAKLPKSDAPAVAAKPVAIEPPVEHVAKLAPPIESVLTVGNGAQSWSPDSVSGQPLQGPWLERPETLAVETPDASDVPSREQFYTNPPPSRNAAFQPTADLQRSAPPSIAAQPAVQAVNSHSFDIDYDLAAGPTTDVMVEVWMTRDDGQHWTRQGVDTDRTSPAQVRVDADGVYGFRIMVQSPRGGSIAPQAGGRPESILRVDTQRPELQLLGVANDPETGANIRWYSKDQHDQEVKIDLLYATNPGGPWEPIARGLANSGAFAWQAAADLPEWVYVRIEASDAAGNRHWAMSERPVQVRPSFRSARILQIRPTADANSPTSTSRY